MTRVTNFGLKRTYLEAGFSNDETPSKETALVEQSPTDPGPTISSEAAPPKKKRKRTPKSKRDGNLTKNDAESKGEAGKNGSEDVTVKSVPATGKSAKKNKKNKERLKKFPILKQDVESELAKNSWRRRVLLAERKAMQQRIVLLLRNPQKTMMGKRSQQMWLEFATDVGRRDTLFHDVKNLQIQQIPIPMLLVLSVKGKGI